MADISKHIRIFDRDPSDDLVTKRTTSILSMAEKYGKLKYYDDFFRLAENISSGITAKKHAISADRTTEVEAAIREESPSFDQEGQELQILTCVMIAALKVIEGAEPSATGWQKPEVLASAIWLTLGIQKPSSKPRLEVLRSELIDASKSLLDQSSSTARNRTAVPDPNVKITEFSDAKVAASVNTGLSKSIEALRQNAALDREELDLLWWALGDWSVVQAKQYTELTAPVAAVTAGVEAGNLMRRLPSEGHKHLVLRSVANDTDTTLADLVKGIGAFAEPVRKSISNYEYIRKFPHVFALLAVISGEAVSSQASSNRDWGARALLEMTVLKLMQNNAVL